MKNNTKNGFDAVKFARDQKDKLSEILSKMTKEEIIAYFKKVRLESQIKPSA
jgi:hypothetical protein